MAWITPTLSATQLPYVPFQTVATVGECYTTYVEPYLPAPEVVQHWHELLLAYVAQPQAIVFIRRYATYAQQQRDTLRRASSRSTLRASATPTAIILSRSSFLHRLWRAASQRSMSLTRLLLTVRFPFLPFFQA